jgi:hypothetical protein
MYRKAAQFWAELRVELLSASEYYAEDKGNSAQIWRQYWASHQVVPLSFYVIVFSITLTSLLINNYWSSLILALITLFR